MPDAMDERAEQIIRSLLESNCAHWGMPNAVASWCRPCRVTMIATALRAIEAATWEEAAELSHGHQINHRDSQRDGAATILDANHLGACADFLGAKFRRRAAQGGGG